MRRSIQGIGATIIAAGIAVGGWQAAQQSAVDVDARLMLASHEARLGALETRAARPTFRPVPTQRPLPTVPLPGTLPPVPTPEPPPTVEPDF